MTTTDGPAPTTPSSAGRVKSYVGVRVLAWILFGQAMLFALIGLGDLLFGSPAPPEAAFAKLVAAGLLAFGSCVLWVLTDIARAAQQAAE